MDENWFNQDTVWIDDDKAFDREHRHYIHSLCYLSVKVIDKRGWGWWFEEWADGQHMYYHPDEHWSYPEEAMRAALNWYREQIGEREWHLSPLRDSLAES